MPSREKALEFLAAASAVVAESLDFNETLQRIAHSAIPSFADIVVVHLIDSDGALQRQVVATTDPSCHDAVEELWSRYRTADANLRQVVETGKSWVGGPYSDERLEAIEDAERRELATRIRARWIVAAPMRTGPDRFGTILFARTDEAQPFEPFEVLIAEEIALRAAAALDRARLFERERAAREDAEKASRAKDEFLAILSHELRTPLTTVLGWADLLKMTYNGGDDSIKFAIDSLRGSAATQARLIDDLLDVSRIVTGKFSIEKRPAELTELVRVATESLRLMAETKGLTLDVDALCCIDVDADPARLNQIVTNLVTNAIKFTPAGGKVIVTVKRRDGEADITVCDTGIGIRPDFLPHVFERFRQGSMGDSRTHAGLGLGLSIVQHLVQLHGGRVRAESDGPGKGATFTVSLPVKDSAQE